MSKGKTRVLFGAAAAVILSALIAVGLWMSKDMEGRVRDFVLTNQVQLEEIAGDCLAGKSFQPSYQGVRVDGVFSGADPATDRIVQFCYTGFGLVPSSTYYGFYYSPENVPVSFQNTGLPLTTCEDGTWQWSDGTDNGGVTKSIGNGWFYYQAWF